jgi:hypothetical protein
MTDNDRFVIASMFGALVVLLGARLSKEQKDEAKGLLRPCFDVVERWANYQVSIK